MSAAIAANYGFQPVRHRGAPSIGTTINRVGQLCASSSTAANHWDMVVGAGRAQVTLIRNKG